MSNGENNANKIEYVESEPKSCPCGGGQSCIVMRRNVGAWVHEDDVLISKGVPIRENCCSATPQQSAAMKEWMEENKGVDSVVYCGR